MTSRTAQVPHDKQQPWHEPVQQSTPQQVRRAQWIMSLVAATAQCLGHELSEEALQIFAHDLFALRDEEIMQSLERCRREVRGMRLTLQDVLSRAGVIPPPEMEDLDAELAWDRTLEVARRFARYVDGESVELRPRLSREDPDCDACNGLGIVIGPGERKGYLVGNWCHCRVREEVPELDQRILDSVQRVGGWGALKELDSGRFPFLRRDFLREYKQWQKLESRRSEKGLDILTIAATKEFSALV